MAQVTVLPDVYEIVGEALWGHAFLSVTGQVEARGAGKALRAMAMQELSTKGN